MHLCFYLKVKTEETQRTHTHTHPVPRSPSRGERTVRLNDKVGTFVSQDNLSYAAATTHRLCGSEQICFSLLCCTLGLAAQSCWTLCNAVDCSQLGSSVHEGSPGKSTGVGCHALLQEIFLAQGSNPGSPTLQADSSPSEPAGNMPVRRPPSIVSTLGPRTPRQARSERRQLPDSRREKLMEPVLALSASTWASRMPSFPLTQSIGQSQPLSHT